MNNDQSANMVRYRYNQAYETLQEAEILLAQKAWRGTVNRAYYAMFYAVLAVLTTRQLSASKHTGQSACSIAILSERAHFRRNFRVPSIWGSISAKPTIMAVCLRSTVRSPQNRSMMRVSFLLPYRRTFKQTGMTWNTHPEYSEHRRVFDHYCRDFRGLVS